MSQLGGGEQASTIPKRLLVVDADRDAWELRARMLIAKGYVVHRIPRIGDAPPRWPSHLYDLVIIRTDDPATPEVKEFCQKLVQERPPVRVFVLTSGKEVGAGGCPVIAADRPEPEILEAITELLSAEKSPTQ